MDTGNSVSHVSHPNIPFGPDKGYTPIVKLVDPELRDIIDLFPGYY